MCTRPTTPVDIPRAGAALVKAGTDGEVDLYNAGPIAVDVDIGLLGYYTVDAVG
ncbi:hypothetical protein DV517_00400 [Streptomyces sp. S816]|nr:hypothetical protein DV517_00400 [Streptomyces sp. S816]